MLTVLFRNLVSTDNRSYKLIREYLTRVKIHQLLFNNKEKLIDSRFRDHVMTIAKKCARKRTVFEVQRRISIAFVDIDRKRFFTNRSGLLFESFINKFDKGFLSHFCLDLSR